MHGPRETQLEYSWGTLFKARQGLERTAKNAELVVAEVRAAAEAQPDLGVHQAVVNRARAKKAKLHDFFTWEDSEAGEKWREEQARDLMRGVKVCAVTILKDGTRAEAKPIPVWASVKVPDEPRRYREVAVLTTTDAGRGALLREAQMQLAQFRNRYAICAELAGVMRAIDRFLDDDPPA